MRLHRGLVLRMFLYRKSSWLRGHTTTYTELKYFDYDRFLTSQPLRMMSAIAGASLMRINASIGSAIFSRMARAWRHRSAREQLPKFRVGQKSLGPHADDLLKACNRIPEHRPLYPVTPSGAQTDEI